MTDTKKGGKENRNWLGDNMKPKAKTQLERMGFNDPDLKTPKHDEMCLWFAQNNKKILKEILTINKTTHSVLLWEQPIMSRGYIIGFADFICYLYEKSEDVGKTHPIKKIVVEIKPEIKSIGETFRQINAYKPYIEDRSYDNKTIYLIVTKTKGLKSLFKSQNIEIIEYEE